MATSKQEQAHLEAQLRSFNNGKQRGILEGLSLVSTLLETLPPKTSLKQIDGKIKDLYATLQDATTFHFQKEIKDVKQS